MELDLYTQAKKEKYTIGRLFIDKTYFCDTLEDPVREMIDLNGDGDATDTGEGKIMGNTAIGEGKYEITLMHSPKFQRELPYLHDVAFFKGVLIHAGNSPDDTQGCILVGENKERGKVINSRAWENVLVKKLREAIDRGQKIFITIHR
jgi:hypothetical protein